ncbi:glycosyltransferase family 4 protein [Arthrobacter koreensis]|uniref:glycosyltransferase family 4 protein n=1 Tax=Arthrobacter koreensis TaxID=199136 RepID=UPI002DBB6971|nr:glycosyltransferase family 4 protein [Arthrobacter koreensis]MEB7505059.1 glycosyltransferase family 4 protein [Arthrobacter koreensis]
MAYDNSAEPYDDVVGTQVDETALFRVALEQLDAAHEEISRLSRLVDNGAGSRSGDVGHMSSRLVGMNALTVAMNEGDYESAYVWAKALFPRLKGNLHFLRAFRDVQSKRGEVTAALALVHRIAEIDKKTSPLAIMKLEGRLREISGWVPKIPGKPSPVMDSVPGRVLHLVKESRPFLSNGFTSRSHQNFKAEKAAGLEPIVVTEPGFPRNMAGNSFKKNETVDGIQHIRLDIGDFDYAGMPADAFLNLFAQLAYEEVLRFKPSVIHASSGRRGYDTALVGLALKNKTGLPFVYEVRSFFEANWTSDVQRETRGEIFERRMQTEAMCMRAADRVLTIGEAMKDELIARGVPSEKIGIIPNAVDASAFVPRPRDPNLARNYGLGNFPTFGYVSNMDHHRESQETLLRATKLLKERGTNFKCVLVGDGPRRAILEKLAIELDIVDSVVFTGSVDHNEIPAYYSLIDYFVVPRTAERAAVYVTPLKPFEAMAMGKPVITSDLPALVEIVKPPLRGFVFETDNDVALADVLQSAHDQPSETEKVAAEGLKWVRTDRTWASNGQRYVTEFGRLVEGADK